MSEQITFILTSSNRFDLLQRTMDSFLNLNKYPIARYIISDDSTSPKCYEAIKKRYGNFCDVYTQKERLGYSTHLDTLFDKVKTEYVFTCEDDWLFYANPKFIEMSLHIYKDNPDIHQVWIRKNGCHNHPLGAIELVSGIKVQPVLKGYQDAWHGFSLNPALRRMSDIKKFFPNGLKEYGDEIICNAHVENMGYKAVALVDSSIRHIGWNRHTRGFKI